MNGLITVFDCGCHAEGTSVALALLQDSQFRLRVVTEHPSGLDSRLRQNSHRFEQCQVNWDNPSSVENALHGAYACFLKTNTNFSRTDCMEEETRKGGLVADACKNAGVSHVVFSTQLNTKQVTGIVVQHMVAKAMIEEYMRSLVLPLTSVIVPVCYEDFTGCYKPVRSPLTGNYEILIPMGLIPLDMVSRDDVGQIVAKIFQNRPKMLHKTISMSGDKLTMKQVADCLTNCLRPIKFVHKQITSNEFSRICGLGGSCDVASMFNFLLRVDQRHWIDTTRNIYPHVKSFQEWTMNNQNMLRNIF